MSQYRKTNTEIWNGRISDQQLYLHEKVQCIDLEKEVLSKATKNSYAILGYACDEGVRRNQGRLGAIEGPDVIRGVLGKMPNHLNSQSQFIDTGNIFCKDHSMEAAQLEFSQQIESLLEQNYIPIGLGGGHDIAYGHYNGIKNYLGKNKTIGIINFDAHLDLRTPKLGSNSGTPFYQIAEDCKKDKTSFNYMCLGIRKDANDSSLFTTAHELRVNYIERSDFIIRNIKNIANQISEFINKVDHIYLTIDLDGFSSAYAPGVSAPSPLGFSTDIVLETLQILISTKKLISVDIAEMNPKYDRDNQTAKLASSLIHCILHSV